MAEKGMVFCDWKVRFIAGMKPGDLGQTRRRVRPMLPTESIEDVKSRYQPGDRVYAKEALVRDPDESWAVYRADGIYAQDAEYDCTIDWPWDVNVLSSRFMPKWAARYWLTIVGVRAERLNEITYPDVVAEGIDFVYVEDWQTAFAAAWDALHGKGAWDRNPWVWVYTFRKEEQ